MPGAGTKLWIYFLSDWTGMLQLELQVSLLPGHLNLYAYYFSPFGIVGIAAAAKIQASPAT